MNSIDSESRSMSIIDRFKAAGSGEAANVSSRELVNEMIKLAATQDGESLLRLYNATKDWQARSLQPGVSGEVVEELSMSNLDFVAQIADVYLGTGDVYFAEIAVRIGPDAVGEITRFYRKTVGYEPPEE